MALFEAVRAVIFRGGDWTLNKVKETTGRNGGTKESTKCSSITPTLASRPIQQMHWTIHIEGGPKRVNHAAVAVGQAIYSFGGYCTNENYSVQRPIDVHILNPVTYRWKVVNFDNDPSVPFQRYGHTVVAYGRYVYLWGGRNDESACKTLFRFDTKTHSWSKPQVTGSIPGARDGHSAVIIRNRMFIFGGYEEDIGLFSQDVYSLDLQTLHWSFVPTAGQPPTFRDFHTATVYLDRYMFIFGGRGDRHGPFHTRTEMYCNILVCLDIERQEWIRPTCRGQVPFGRRSHSAFMHNGFMYIFGGYNGLLDRHYNDLYRYDPESREWNQLKACGEGPEPRRRQACVVLDNRVFLFGGTSPCPTVTPRARRSDLDDPDPDPDGFEENNLTDHDDMFVLDMEPSLKTISMLNVLRYKLDTSGLPRILKQELSWMRIPNRITPLSSG